MDYKQKYEQALEYMRKVYPTLNGADKEDAEHYFPELKESEDERIRKSIIKLLQRGGYMSPEDKDKAFAWLEKHGEKKPVDKKYTFNALPRLLDMIQPTDRAKAYCQKLIDILIQEGYNVDARVVGTCLKRMNGEKVAMATMDEQKPADKVEPEFKVGDWIVPRDIGIYKIVEVCESWYEVVSCNNGMQYSIGFDKEKDCHLWTIQDAKDGDVLTTDTVIFIFNYIEGNWVFIKCSYNSISNSFGISSTSEVNAEYVYPATKEQCDLLFQKMKEVGYEWDDEKKELKKIEQKPTWSEEDEKEVTILEAYIRSKDWSDRHVDRALGIVDELVNKVKSVRPQPKQEWSEEDEGWMKSTFDKLSIEGDMCLGEKCWIQSLKQRMKGE